VRRGTLPVLFLVVAIVSGTGAAAGQEAVAVMAPLAPKSLLLDAARAGGRIVAVGERGHILLSSDSGGSWRQVAAPTQATLTAVHFFDDRLGWAVGHDAVILRSGDGGESWERVNFDPETGTPLFDVYFTDVDHGFAIGAYGLFLESADGGRSWQARAIGDSDAHLHHVARSPDGRLYIVGEWGRLLRSDDGGARWTELASPYGGSLFGSFVLGAGQELLLYGLRGHAFRSEDRGRSWHGVATGTDVMLTDACRMADGRIIVSGLGGVLLSSGDGGRTFTVHAQPDRRGISAVVAAPDGGVVLVGEFGVRKLPAGALAETSR